MHKLGKTLISINKNTETDVPDINAWSQATNGSKRPQGRNCKKNLETE